ncbi:MAG: ATP-binding protein [Burkholderiaceae bacterium]
MMLGAKLLPHMPSFGNRRRLLWAMLVVLVAAVLVMLVWLAGRYEASEVQGRLDRDVNDAVADLRNALGRNAQSLQALQSRNMARTDTRSADATTLLREHRELLRIEWRDSALAMVAGSDTPFRAPVFNPAARGSEQSEMLVACTNARRAGGPAYSPSYFVPQRDGMGMEVMELCLPSNSGAAIAGYLVATYSLNDILTEIVGKHLPRGQDASFTEADGTRLAFHGVARRGNRAFTASQLLNLPGVTMVLRLDSWRVMPDLFPNFLTAMVVAMTIALASVLVLLGRDMRKRQSAEQRLADALAFRKAMENSLVTGLRARDLQGRTTYVNPAFCKMVGFSAAELIGRASAPYWPSELVGEYRLRQTLRLQGHTPAPEGFESVFMRKDGGRFPVLIFETPLINAQAVQSGWMSAVMDLSEQRRVEELSRASYERLQATARLATVGEMASLLSHELNQPLAAISSYAAGSINMLKESGPNGPGLHLQEAMRQIAEQAHRAGRVIKSVHDFVRRREHAREPVQARALFDAVAPLVSLQARKLDVRIELRLEEPLPYAFCDRTMVEQVLLNLARNAMQAMDDAAIMERTLAMAVKLAPSSARSSPSGGWLEFSVTDTGSGIAREVAEKLFTPLFTTKTEGMGLGLSLCRTVIEQHGGFLQFSANSPRGTVFRFTLPVAAVPQPESELVQVVPGTAP